MATKTTKKRKPAAKKRTNSAAGAAGKAGFKLMTGLTNLSMPYASTADDIDTNEIPPFVLILAGLMGLVVLGFVIYIGVILLGEAWHKYF